MITHAIESILISTAKEYIGYTVSFKDIIYVYVN